MRNRRKPTRARWLVLALGVTLVAAACGDDDDDTATSETTAASGAGSATTAAGGAVTSLKDVCPDPLIIQTDWYPEPDHGYSYEAAGTEGTFDKSTGVYTGTLKGTDIQLEIRAGGPFVSFAAPTQQMYADSSIFMAYADTGDAIRNAAKQPLKGVFTPYEKGPQIIMWDPAKYPDVKTIADIGTTAGAGKVLYFQGGAYMDYLLGKGILKESQIDSNYDGSPSRFVAEGDLFQQGFATNEIYKYENDIAEWKKPVAFALVHDTGFEIYQSALSVKPESITERADCLKAVVPIFQQAAVDYQANPGPTNALLEKIVGELADPGWTLSAAGDADAVQKMKDLGLVSNGSNTTIGDFDDARTQKLIDEFNPIEKAAGVEGVQDGLKAADIQTNEFLDMSIGLR
jgi:hypothetical protein